VFFALSGYLITNLLLETKEMRLPAYLGRFYWRRFLRIFPLYFGFVLAVTLVYLATHWPSGVGEQFPWLATFTYNFYMGLEHQAGLQQVFHVLWSISTEEQYYLIWPVVVWLMPRRWLIVIALGLIFAAPLVRWFEADWVRSMGISVASEGKLVYYFPFGQVDAFAIGTLIALVKNAPWVRRPLLWSIGLALPTFLVIVRQIILSLGPNGIPMPIHLGFPVNSTLYGFHVWGYSAGYLAFASLLILVLYGQRKLWIRRCCESEPARWIGKISFGLYVFHWPLLLAMELVWPISANLPLRLVQFTCFGAVLTAIAWLSFRYYETWFLGKKELLFAEKPKATQR
jgi:peptidoglycan/LPS O-acetylase OafA/YrhL